MAVISVQFFIFAIIVIFLYFLQPLKSRPYWLLLTSLFFYASFDVAYFLCLGITVITTFIAAIFIYYTKKTTVNDCLYV